ncbi:MAG: hypothetical protein ACUVTN_10660 [Thermodesulfobacteriota bacterium]
MGKDKFLNSHGAYHFKLFIAGDEPNSRMAKESLTRLCENHLRGKYVIAVTGAPQGETKIIGSLNDERKILKVLGLSEGRERG